MISRYYKCISCDVYKSWDEPALDIIFGTNFNISKRFNELYLRKTFRNIESRQNHKKNDI